MLWQHPPGVKNSGRQSSFAPEADLTGDGPGGAPRRRRQNLETAYCEEAAGPHAEGVTKGAKLVGCADGVVD